jgi:hypothetical protein
MKHKQNKKPSKKIIIGAGIAALLLIGQLVFNLYAYNYMRQSHTPAIIPLITTALEGLHKDAAVDPKTGDSYFPEAKLYVKAQKDQPPLIYNYDTTNSQLSITSKYVLSTIESRLWSAYSSNGQNENKAMTAIFDAMPGSQACSRGVQLFYAEQTSDNMKLQFTTQLKNGKTLYGYTEPKCYYDLSAMVAAAKTIQSY